MFPHALHAVMTQLYKVASRSMMLDPSVVVALAVQYPEIKL